MPSEKLLIEADPMVTVEARTGEASQGREDAARKPADLMQKSRRVVFISPPRSADLVAIVQKRSANRR